MIVLDNVYDNYNHTMKSNGICGTLTAGCGSWTNCGCFYVIEKYTQSNEVKSYDNKTREYSK